MSAYVTWRRNFHILNHVHDVVKHSSRDITRVQVEKSRAGFAIPIQEISS